MTRRKSGNQLAFNDMLFNILLGFVVLFIIAFLLINPITKKQDIPAKAEMMIVAEWSDNSETDVDLWVQHDRYIPVGFNNKSGMGINLERDDLGVANDWVRIDGDTQIIRSNREVVNMRGVIPGNFYINVHAYSFKDSGPLEVSITVIDINPTYKEIYKIKVTLESRGSIARAPAFSVNNQGEVTKVFNHTKNIVPNKRN